MFYDAANRITTIQDGPTRVTMVYDNNGNLTQEQRGAVNTDFAYDRENRMSAVRISAGLLTSYTHDGDGLKVKDQDVNESPEFHYYVWDGTDYLGETGF